MAIGQLVDWSVAGTHKQPERAMSYVCFVCWETAASSDNKQKQNQKNNSSGSWGRQNVAQSNCANRRTKPVNKLVLNGQYGQLPYIE